MQIIIGEYWNGTQQTYRQYLYYKIYPRTISIFDPILRLTISYYCLGCFYTHIHDKLERISEMRPENEIQENENNFCAICAASLLYYGLCDMNYRY